MKKPSLIWLTAISLLLFAVFLLSCEKNYITQAPEEHAGDYDLLYIHAGGEYNGPLNTLIYSTKSGELIDTIKTQYFIEDLRFAKDGLKAVIGSWEPSTLNPSVLAVNYPNMDTIAIRDGVICRRMEFSPNEQSVFCCDGTMVSILSYPDLSNIYIDTVENFDGGFLTSVDSAFYLVSGIDSIFVIDYSDRQNVTVSTATIGSISGGGTVPVSCAVDYINERIIIVSNYNDEKSYIHVLNSNDLSMIQFLVVDRLYNGSLAIRPESDKIYLKLSGNYGDFEHNYIDVYNVYSNTQSKFINFGDITFIGVHLPYKMEFTPDGKTLYVLMGSNQYSPFNVLGFDPDTGDIMQFLAPESSAGGQIIRINPINRLI